MIDPYKHQMNQACDTAHDTLRRARDDVNALFGEGAARQMPQVVAAYAHAAALDYQTHVMADAITRVGTDIADGIHALAKAIASLSAERPK